mmetsp:Transcript_2565/g.9159  ORF Transcript_2565/g.9159 Transcript_2565/m.9159 type:complete len:226 (+) Transcript_2565:421-1098(+)
MALFRFCCTFFGLHSMASITLVHIVRMMSLSAREASSDLAFTKSITESTSSSCATISDNSLPSSLSLTSDSFFLKCSTSLCSPAPSKWLLKCSGALLDTGNSSISLSSTFPFLRMSMRSSKLPCRRKSFANMVKKSRDVPFATRVEFISASNTFSGCTPSFCWKIMAVASPNFSRPSLSKCSRDWISLHSTFSSDLMRKGLLRMIFCSRSTNGRSFSCVASWSIR